MRLCFQPGTVLEYANPLLSPAKPHTLSAMEHINGKWTAADLGNALSDGRITISSGDRQLTITNLRFYNWKQEPVETEFDLTTDIRRMPVADNLLNGIVVDINADNFATGDTIPISTTTVSKAILKPCHNRRHHRNRRKEGIQV